MTFRPPLLVVGILGFLAFVVTGLTGTIPWPASGPLAVPFVALVIGEIREYFEREKAKSSAPAPQTAKPPKFPAPKIEKKSEPEAKPEPKPEPKPQSKPELVTILKDNQIRLAEVIERKSFKKYKATLLEGDFLTAHAGADDWIRIELLNLTESQKKDSGSSWYNWERRKDGKNPTIE